MLKKIVKLLATDEKGEFETVKVSGRNAHVLHWLLMEDKCTQKELAGKLRVDAGDLCKNITALKIKLSQLLKQ